MRDYLKWRDAYDDPNSDLSWRLRQAQTYIRQALDHLPGPVTVLSRCAGDGRDVLQVLADRDDFSRVQTTLIELHPVLAERAREFAAEAGLTRVTVRSQDAGNTDKQPDVDHNIWAELRARWQSQWHPLRTRDESARQDATAQMPATPPDRPRAAPGCRSCGS